MESRRLFSTEGIKGLWHDAMSWVSANGRDITALFMVLCFIAGILYIGRFFRIF